ncbi:hypothetical protein WJX84_004437 [Apatococcus fuscideae]|uniref:nitric-oxide synthase (NADPH) n=1 Tax=Apatococcus fuscideae TaxID=2026836 RepID=A0AAW1TEW1_9CHLO
MAIGQVSKTALLDPAPLVSELGSSESGAPVAPCAHSSHTRPRYNPRALGVNQCPFRHCSVDALPYSGYVHGRHPEVCPHKCKPVVGIAENETKKQTLIREAMEYQELFHHEHNSPQEVKAARVEEILGLIEKTGSYTHTFDELQHGARVAWRNAPKCGNRRVAMELNLLDKRGVNTAEEMNLACLDMLEMAATSGATKTFLTAFDPEHSLTGEGGARVWNTQLLRYAGYRQNDMSISGDPSELQFTELCQRKFGWRPPGGKEGKFDILPLILQLQPDVAPQMYEIPESYAVEVPLIHPTHHWFSELGLKWYAIPAVSNMVLSLGGLLYTGTPFSGWYADSEIVRNLTDEGRYNQLPIIAQRLGYSIADNCSLWRDAALVVLNQASPACSLPQARPERLQFWTWHAAELKTRGYSPGNWKWIIPPLAAHTSKCYTGLNKMIEYTLKPALLYAPGFKEYARAWFGPSFDRHEPPMKPALLNPYVAKLVGRIKRPTSVRQPQVLLMFATVTGNAKQLATRVKPPSSL